MKRQRPQDHDAALQRIQGQHLLTPPGVPVGAPALPAVHQLAQGELGANAVRRQLLRRLAGARQLVVDDAVEHVKDVSGDCELHSLEAAREASQDLLEDSSHLGGQVQHALWQHHMGKRNRATYSAETQARYS